jgi:23S rRNA (pseudouridine1915-N3)-methyltransferase
MTFRITVAAVGRLRQAPERALFEAYAARLSWPLHVQEIELRGGAARGNAAGRRAAEAKRLMATVPREAIMVALDEKGTTMDSAAFAARLAAWRDGGRREIAFLIGGPDGLDPRVRSSADLMLSLGTMTWPHLLVRALLVEQLYRAQQILAGHPYHRA